MWRQKKSPSNADAMIARHEAAPHNTSETTITSQGDFERYWYGFPQNNGSITKNGCFIIPSLSSIFITF